MSQKQPIQDWEEIIGIKSKKMPIDNAKLIARLTKPAGKVDVILDTDTYNEIDDQFALAYLIKSDEKLNLQAIYAAPFYNHHSDSPGDGMEKSYHEILKVLNLMGRREFEQVTYRGSETYLPDDKQNCGNLAWGKRSGMAQQPRV